MLRLSNVVKKFQSDQGQVDAVDNVSFEVPEGEFFTLLGPSGCGKSTTLRCVAGLESIDGGEIAIDGQVVASRSSFVPPNERPISMVFQSYAIWPHMSVLGNVTLPLTYRGSANGKRVPRNQRRERGMEALKLVQLEHLADRPAPYLSGGQQQRVALARALAVRPKLLLLDEPLSNLDAKLREEMRFEIKGLTNKVGIATLYVTHDQGEALTMSDRIAVMTQGEIIQVGKPPEIYRTPLTGRVARIVGSVNLLHGQLASRDGGMAEVKTRSGHMLRAHVVGEQQAGDDLEVMFRPEVVQIHPRSAEVSAPGDEQLNALPGVVQSALFAGDHIACHVDTDDGIVAAKLVPSTSIKAGDHVNILIPAESCIAS